MIDIFDILYTLGILLIALIIILILPHPKPKDI